MPSSTTFTGALLRLQSVTPINQGATLRVRYTQDPRQTNPAGANDALNVANYTLTGPVTVAITGSSTVSGDTQSIYLVLAAPLPAGTWTLAVANVQTPSGAVLFPPTSIQFSISASTSTSRVNAGSFNDSSEEIIRKHLSPGIAQYETGWSALIAALSAGDNTNFENARLAYNQLYKSTASGIYLDRRSADDGIIRPDSVGIGDDVFRRLSIKTTTKKVVTQAILEILEVYYGTDSTRAHLTTDVGEPYNIQAGWTLLLSIDGEPTVTVPFSVDDFASISLAKAAEVAAVITRWLKANGSTAYALEFVDPDTGAKKPVIYSGSLGLQSSVQVLGGQAQNVLQFPTLLTQSQAANTWAVSKPGPGLARYKIVGVTTTDLNQVFVGDYVNVFGDNFNDDNQGTFVITAVDVRYVSGTLEQFFEVANDFAVVQGAVTIVGPTDLMFFRATKTTINDNGARAVIVAQTEDGRVDVQFPATTVAVQRTARSAAYLQTPEALVPTSLTRLQSGVVTAITAVNHGLSVGSQVLFDGIQPSSTPPATVAGNGTSTTDASLVTIWSPTAAPAGNAVQFPEAVTLNDGRAFFVGGRTIAPAAASDTRVFAITAANTLGGGQVQYTYTWTARAALPVATYSHRMTVLNDSLQTGNVLLTGGWSGAGAPFATAYLYSVSANTWTATPSMTVVRQDHAQLTLADTRVLVVAGRNANAGTQTGACDLFTPTGATGVFNATGTLAIPRYKLGVFQLANGNVIACGGYTGVGDTLPTATCESWSPSTGLWTSASPMTYSRGAPVVIPLGANQFLVSGGFGKVGTTSSAVASAALRTAEIFDGNTGRWYPAKSMNAVRANIRGATISGTDAVVAGDTTTAQYFNVGTREWSTIRAAPSHGFNAGLAKVSFGGTDLVLIFGGSNDGTTPLADATLLVRASDAISLGGLMQPLRVASIVSPTVFTVETPDYRGYTTNVATDATIIPFRALAGAFPGPYLLSPDSGPAVTGTVSSLSTAVAANSQYAVLKLTTGEAALFPDEPGWLVLGFGTGVELFPVRYLGRANPDELLLDYGQQFPADLPVGTTVTLLLQKGPFNPDNPQNLGVFYLTDSSSGRVAASSNIDAVVAAGINLVKTIVYPGDRGLSGEGLPVHGVPKLSDRVSVWAGNEVDDEVETAREDV